jgi:hypothetical protein
MHATAPPRGLMTTGAITPARPRWQSVLLQLALSVPELVIALGFGFAAFVGAMALGCRVVGVSVCDSAGGLAVVVVAMGTGILVGVGYWLLALALGLTGLRRARYGLDAVAAVLGVATYGMLWWQDHGAIAAARAAAEAASRNEAAAAEAWIAALRQNPDGHGPPGVVPPMLEVVDEGRNVHVTNTTQEWLTVALARVLQDNQREWLACPLLTVGEHADYYRFSIGPGRTAQYAPLPDCAAGFEGAPLEYRVGDPLPNETGWWSDTAFAVPKGRIP